MRLGRKFALLLPVVVLLSCLSGCGQTADSLRLGTGGEGGTYYAYGNALAPLMTEVTGRETEVLTTTGSEANLRLLRGDLLDLAIVQSDTLKYTEDGEKYSAMAGIYTEACQIVVTKASGITSVAGLAGKRVSVGADESGVTRNAEQILMASGLTTDMLQAERLSFADSAAAMERGEIDAFFCTAGAPTNAVAELAGRMDIRLLSIDQRSIDQLTSLYNCYAACTIPAGTYQGQTEDVTTLGVRAVLVAGNGVDAGVVKEITSVLFSHNSVLQEAVAMDASLSPEDAVQAVPVPFHPGAADYYGEQGISVERWAPEKEGLTLPLHISLDMYQTLAAAVVILFLGAWLKKRVKVLETFCIPSPVVGGHGTAGAFGPTLEGLGLEGATTLCTAAATFGLIAGSLMGGPLGRRLILKHDLLKTAVPVDDEVLVEDEQKHHRSARGYAPAAYQIAIAMDASPNSHAIIPADPGTAGNPPAKTVGGFSDVLESAYFAQPVVWAVEQKIANGTGDGRFTPDAPCTRAMAVTYMWKQASSPSAPAASFSDVPASADYAPAVAWAVDKGVTSGTGNNQFTPDGTCPRGQIVTFLYRAFAK